MVLNVESLEKGVYRYLPLDHALECIYQKNDIENDMADTFNNAMQNQDYTKKAGIVFYWTCFQQRAKWRNQDTYPKLVLLELGHIVENLYLSAESINCGCVEIAGYHQVKADNLLKVDGENEFTVFCVAVGNIDSDQKDVYKNINDIRR